MGLLHRFILAGIFVLCFGLATAQRISVEANYHSAAVEISIPAQWDGDGNGWAEVKYKSTTDSEWLASVKPDPIEFNGERSFRCSLFGLKPGMSYQVKAILSDTIPIQDSSHLSEVRFTTKPEPVFTNTASRKWVSPQGSGTSYTEANPGNLKTLLAAGLQCGTTVLLKDGSYYEGDMYLNIRQSCTDSTPIIIKAAPDAKPVIDGRLNRKLTWTQNVSDTLLYTASLPSEAQYTNLLVLNGERLYPYSTLGNNPFLGNFNLLALNFGFNGFVRDASRIHLKTKEGYNPNNEDVIISSQFRGLTVQGFNNDVFLRLQGITFQHYGKSRVDFSGGYNARCLSIANANDVIIDNCAFIFCDFPLRFSGGCSEVTLQNSRIKDNVGSWTHAMIKKSFANQTLAIPTSMGRSLENAGMYYSEGSNSSKNLVIRNCIIDGPGDGVGFGTANTGVYNVDFYNNEVKNCFDGVEFDNLFSNLKIWNNRIEHNVASVSLAPPRLGPVYVYRNEMVDMVSRDNSITDTYFTRCQPPTAYRSQGIGIKTNIGGPTTNGSYLHFINNTFHSNDSDAFVQYLWDDEWTNIQFINNIFYNPNNTLFFNNGINGINGKPDSSFQFSSEYDAYYSASKPPLVIKKVHGQYDCIAVNSVDSMEAIWSSQMNSKYISIDNFQMSDPKFVDEPGGDFKLKTESTLIENGVIVPGFYDYIGRVPDIGANESSVDSTLSHREVTILDQISVYPNPCTDLLHIRVLKPIQQLEVYDVPGHKVLAHTNLSQGDTFVINTTHWKTGLYIVKVDNGYQKVLKIRY
jgi:hypothetical protein